jgi:D-alanyl-lipoteichoic acid acyltransferase DltB (MBOAT superfamily)
MLVADNIGVQVDYVWGNISQFGGVSLVAAAFLYSIQIYCDFSGYADIAIGTA